MLNTETITNKDTLIKLGYDLNKDPNLSDLKRFHRNDFVHFEKMPRFDDTLEIMYIYCDIVDEMQIGNIFSPYIRMIHLSETLRKVNKDGDMIGTEKIAFNKLQYFPVKKKVIKEITEAEG